MKKHLIITRLFEFGGSNAHLHLLVEYLGSKNIVLLLEDHNELRYLNHILPGYEPSVIIRPDLHRFAHLNYASFLSNGKELLKVLASVLRILWLSARNGFADVTICVVEPEKYLYLLWLPWVTVVYVLHTTPGHQFTTFTPYTCNTRLGERKKIVTVSKANRDLLVQNWGIKNAKKSFIYVVYNCLPEKERHVHRSAAEGKQNIITLGHVTDYKNPAIWLEVAKTVTSMRRQINFIWVGNGPLLDDFQSQTKGNKHISFPGLATNTDSFFKEAMIYYQPSLHETHGIAVVEAMYYHLPCVVSNTGGLPESITQNDSGFLVSPNHPREHVDALLTLIDNPQIRKQFGDNAFKKFSSSFTFEQFKYSMDAVYRRKNT